MSGGDGLDGLDGPGDLGDLGDLGDGEVEAALAARHELGRRYDRELVESFAERIEREVERRVEETIAVRRSQQAATAGAGGRQLALGIVTLVACIPLGVALGVNGELTALAIVLAALVAVNWAHAWQSRG